jgi:uncharacterized protein (DUF1015 family)
MKKEDFRFNQGILQSCIGQTFEKYRCDKFDFTNSVTQIVGLFISGKVFSLKNEQETVDYYGEKEDISIYKLQVEENDIIRSAFDNVDQIDTPIKGIIESITVVNENQQIYKTGELLYDVWITRGVIFHVDGREIMFEKDIVPFSEEIIIQRGYNLIEKIASPDDFLEGWSEDFTSNVSRDIISLE